MNKNFRIGFASIIIVAVVIYGVSACAKHANSKYYVLASALIKLSRTVETFVMYEDVPQDVTEKELLLRATAEDQSLLKPFNNYSIHVKRVDSHVLLLVCSKNDKIGFLEDSGCTAAMDKHLWQNNSPLPCAFTINMSNLCAN